MRQSQKAEQIESTSISVSSMLERIASLLGTSALSECESRFIGRLSGRARAEQVTPLTGFEIERLAEIYRRHFE